VSPGRQDLRARKCPSAAPVWAARGGRGLHPASGLADGGPRQARGSRAEASLHSGAFEAAREMLATAETSPLNALQRARVALLRGLTALAERLDSDAPCCSRRPNSWSRSSPPRAGGQRGEHPRAPAPAAGRAHGPGARDRATGSGRAHQRRDRRTTLPQPAHRRVASGPRVHQRRRLTTSRAAARGAHARSRAPRPVAGTRRARPCRV
jgi:hypothetical protein